MIFQHTHELVVSGQKTQTRRLWKPEWDFDDTGRVIAVSKALYNIRTVYYIGQQLAVQPGRGKPAIARIEIVSLGFEDVRSISEQDAKAEGYDDVPDFLGAWTSMHDTPVRFYIKGENLYYRGPRSRGLGTYKASSLLWLLNQRPEDRYKAAVIAFRLLEGGAQ